MTTDLKTEEPCFADACGWTRAQVRVRLANEAMAWMEDNSVDCAINALYICPSTNEVTMEMTARAIVPWTQSGENVSLWDDSYRVEEPKARKQEAKIVESVCHAVERGRAYTWEEAEAFYKGRAARRAGRPWSDVRPPANPETIDALFAGWNAADAEIAAMHAEYHSRFDGSES